jgi:hypothetical protein
VLLRLLLENDGQSLGEIAVLNHLGVAASGRPLRGIDDHSGSKVKEKRAPFRGRAQKPGWGGREDGTQKTRAAGRLSIWPSDEQFQLVGHAGSDVGLTCPGLGGRG